jgi:Tfp pilus assembly protein PilN
VNIEAVSNLAITLDFTPCGELIATGLNQLIEFMAKKEKGAINLLPQEVFAGTTAGRVLSWLLSTFRTIVILVEVVVVSAFISRFFLDAKNSDLDEAIKLNEQIIASNQTFEKDFKNIQSRLQTYGEFEQKKLETAEVVEKITPYLPPDVLLNSITIEDDKLNLSGESPSEQSIQQLLVNLNSIETLENVILTNVGSKPGQVVLAFNMTAVIKKEATQK